MKNFIVIAETGDFIGEAKLIHQYLNGQWVNNEAEEKIWRMSDGVLWQVIVTGVGALNVLKTLRNLPSDARILNIGYAGSANYEIGSVVEVSEARLNHPNVQYSEPCLPLLPLDSVWLRPAVRTIPAVCYSNTDFVLQSDYKDCVFDMELAYIVGMGFSHVSSLKIVSDNLSLHAYREVAAGV